MRVLVTGGEGWTGRFMVPALRGRGHTVFSIDLVPTRKPDYALADVVYMDDVRRVVGRFSPDAIVHLAADVSRMSCEEGPYRAIDTNIVGTMNVVRAALEYGASLVYVSTSEIYGDAFGANAIVTEDMRPSRFNGVYGLSKYQGEQYVEYFAGRYGLKAAIVRPFMGYGPGDEPSDYRCAITRFIAAFMRGEAPEVHEKTLRQWCYVDDFVLGEILVLEKAKSVRRGGAPDIYNVGHQDVWRTERVAELVREEMGRPDIPIRAVPCPHDIIPVKIGSFDKARADLGFEAKVSLRDGLRSTVSWCKKNWP